jgi:hypothetical protein
MSRSLSTCCVIHPPLFHFTKTTIQAADTTYHCRSFILFEQNIYNQRLKKQSKNGLMSEHTHKIKRVWTLVTTIEKDRIARQTGEKYENSL